MKKAVKDDPVQLMGEGGPEELSVLPDPGNTDVDLPFDKSRLVCVSECDDVREVVVVEEVLIDLQKPLVVTENILQRSQSMPLPSYQFTQEILQSGPVSKCGHRLWKKELEFTHVRHKINVPGITL